MWQEERERKFDRYLIEAARLRDYLNKRILTIFILALVPVFLWDIFAPRDVPAFSSPIIEVSISVMVWAVTLIVGGVVYINKFGAAKSQEIEMDQRMPGFSDFSKAFNRRKSERELRKLLPY